MFVSERISTRTKKDSQSKRKQWSSEVAPTNGVEDPFTRLASANGMPLKNMQTTIEQEKQNDTPYDAKSEEPSDSGNNHDFDTGDDLDAALKELLNLR